MTALPTALITGASSGIGATYADRLARRGHPLKLVARDGRRLEAVAERLRAQTGVAIETRLADLTRGDTLRAIADWIAADASLGLLVNNAGVAVVGRMLDADPGRLDAMIQLNAIASTQLALAAARNFASRGTGTIVNIASVVALMPERFHGVYSGTKAYLLNFSQALHGEVGPLGVRVQIVLPGATRTAIWENAGTSADALPAEMLMDVDEMVDAALAGLDQGELVSIPSLDRAERFDALTAVRAQLAPDLSLRHAATRYRVARH